MRSIGGGLAPLVGGVVRVAADVDRRRAHRARGDRGLGAGRLAHVDEAPERLAARSAPPAPARPRAGRARGRSHRPPPPRAARRRGPGSRAAPSHRRRARARAPAPPRCGRPPRRGRRRAASRPGPRSGRPLRSLRAPAPTRPAASAPRHSSGSQAASPATPRQTASAGVEPGRDRVTAPGLDQRPLGERPVRLDARVEVDEAAVVAPADALLARDVRRRRGARSGTSRSRCARRPGSSRRRARRAARRHRTEPGRRTRPAPGSRHVRAGSRLALRGYYDPPFGWTTRRSPTTSRASCPA